MTVPPQDGWRPDHDQPAGPSQPPPTVNGLKWLLIAVAVLLVVGISVGATLIVTRGGKGAATKPALSDSTSDIASANDTGPVSIITDEPTCAAYLRISNSLSEVESKGWGAQRAALGPASSWTPDQRARVDEVATAMRNTADQVVQFAKRTPHRLIRQLYEQFIAYGRAYADSVPNYKSQDNGLASANVNAGSAIVGICNTIEYSSASRAVGVQPAAPPSQTAKVVDPERSDRFIAVPSPICTVWTNRLDDFTASTPEWQIRDTNIPASSWTIKERQVELNARSLLTNYADEIQRAGRGSGNPVLEDFAVAAALYIDAFVSAGDNYNGAADSWLNFVAFRLANLVSGACRAVAG